MQGDLARADMSFHKKQNQAIKSRKNLAVK